ncbi:MAG: hypothetical protein A2513_01580 [Sulfurimonas sp. RIFOXYD12_FULL_33_39]|uniref:PLDc N-terminal domain-containing protein n=1 Tax=unclassified Sulfurimonas TaxID=2623549 RepID=UPI0008AB8C4F|nr:MULTISPECIES: PLDc N-terminal domain-containing protein [unclassified Sulfurimonas]OHE08692.1 MAG: hypothetical protein A2513_01580 [Sulfurimonas sp. RIFOXYD12_FULL_33_39]OHE13977.1 MAG: hypothetical protein A2530_02905 [Sulfurimonas sp. RIFOXYD2_FULL_34_21]DAB27612.1 MAG TPA: hypothetical protein CFH78_06985 [Sulfurimonas sp. UBA10385]
MSNVTLVIFFLFIVFWLYSIISVFTSEFKDKKQKVFWSIGIIFVPFLAFFYLFMKKNLLQNK